MAFTGGLMKRHGYHNLPRALLLVKVASRKSTSLFGAWIRSEHGTAVVPRPVSRLVLGYRHLYEFRL